MTKPKAAVPLPEPKIQPPAPAPELAVAPPSELAALPVPAEREPTNLFQIVGTGSDGTMGIRAECVLKKSSVLVRAQTGQDLSPNRPSTIRRHIERQSPARAD